MATTPSSDAVDADYAWEIATLLAEQGQWSDEAYLRLTDGTNHRIECTDGQLALLPMPTDIHETLVQFLFISLHSFVNQGSLGKVHGTGIRFRIRPRKFRLPDIIFLHKDHFHARHNRAWDGADIVMEVVSDDPKDRERDYKTKLLDYAEAKVPEYWIIDYERRFVLVHRLDASQYASPAQFTPGQQATSYLLDGFSIDVAALFAAADEIPE